MEDNGTGISKIECQLNIYSSYFLV